MFNSWYNIICTKKQNVSLSLQHCTVQLYNARCTVQHNDDILQARPVACVEFVSGL